MPVGVASGGKQFVIHSVSLTGMLFLQISAWLCLKNVKLENKENGEQYVLSVSYEGIAYWPTQGLFRRM